MKTIVGCVVILLSMLGTLSEATATDESKASLSKKHSLSSIVNVKNKEKLIEFLKFYPANKIQPGIINVPLHGLPEIPLEKWLKSVTGNAPLEWTGGECASYDSNNDDNEEHCVSLLVEVNTQKDRCPSTELRFIIDQDAKVYLMYEGSEVNDFCAHGGLEQLADLEKVLGEAKAKTVPIRPSNSSIDRLRARKGADIAHFAAGLDVHRFDPALPSERFDKWLERTAGWPFQWMIYPSYFHHCSFTPLAVYVRPVVDAERQSPPVYISMELGSWEEESKGEPKLHLYSVGTDPGSENEKLDPVENLSALKKIIDAWKAAPKRISPKAIALKQVVPTKKPTAPVEQNMAPLGGFSRIWSTPTGHCYGHILSLWKYRERVFGTHHDIGGQCADSREPTYIIRDVNFDPQTGKIEFWSYGIPGYKFVGKVDQNMVTGEFLGMHEEEGVKLKRSKERNKIIPDSDKNVEVWCKYYAPTIRYIQ
ncbi:MAG TPA: hypothetical protein VI913_01335, partial [Candidatus Peribacteraceae bacterium]|nr:hypothetical protein [Candidatus Peribacteraceae bacterium]